MKINLRSITIVFISLLTLPDFTKSEYIQIYIIKENNPNPVKTIGPNGTFGLVTDTKTLSNILEEETFFKASFKDKENNKYYLDCSLWDPEDMNLIILCSMNELNINNSIRQFRFDFGLIKKDDYYIRIKSKEINYYIDIEMKPFNIPFVYSQRQIINLDKPEDSYELKFKAKSYKMEKLALVENVEGKLFNYFEKIIPNENELICIIGRKKIEEIIKNNKALSLFYLNEDFIQYKFEFVGEILVQYSLPKQNIFIFINEVLNSVSESPSLVYFKTNITEISPLTTDIFNININSNLEIDSIECFFKKYNNKLNPLLLLCENIKEDYSISSFKEKQIYLENIHYKYNFIIDNSKHLRRISEDLPFNTIAPNQIVLSLDNEVILTITKKYFYYDPIIGAKSTISFETDYNDNELNIFNASNIEEKTVFKSIFLDDLNNEYNVTGRLWKPMNDTIRVFYYIEEELDKNAKYIYLNKTTFEYNNEYNITMISEIGKISIKKAIGNVPFLYSNQQEINMVQNQEYYDLKFNIVSYNNELLNLKADNSDIIIILDNCTINNKELICTFTKTEMEEFLTKDENVFLLNAFSDNNGLIYLTCVLRITLIYKNVNKENIYINITKLKENDGPKEKFIAYETNTNYTNSIKNFVSDYFSLNFVGYDKNNDCKFKKSINSNVLLLCEFSKEGTFVLEQTSSIIEVNNKHILYNFIILPITNDENIRILKGISDNFVNNYPRILNFIQQNSLTVLFYHFYNYIDSNFKINPNAEEFLQCQHFSGVSKCNVPISHFDNKPSGYYNTYDSESILYELSPFNVILSDLIRITIKEENNKDIIYVNSEQGFIYFITDYSDEEQNILEGITSFNARLFDQEKNNYYTTCSFWQPKNDKLVLFCNLNLKNSKELNLSIYDTLILYEDIRISVLSETFVRIKVIEYFPFIYSDNQTININNNIQFYELNFKFKNFNEDDFIFFDCIFYINGTQNNYAILDNCTTHKNDIICLLSKEKLETVLTHNNEIFKVGVVVSDYGAIPFKLIKNISINKEIDKKEDIYVGITGLLDNVVETYYPFAYDTNISSINDLISYNFSLKFNIRNIYCYFKKTQNNNLLLLCVCTVIGRARIELLAIEEEIILNDIHHKYNFRIQPFKLAKSINLEKVGTSVEFVYPETLNFTSSNLISFNIIMKSPSFLGDIKINLDSSYNLNCNDYINMKKCFVSLKDLRTQKSGNYQIYYLNYLKAYSPYYHLNPIRVIYNKKIEIGLADNYDLNDFKIGEKGVLYFVTNFYDSNYMLEPNKTAFFPGNYSLSGKSKIYESNCQFWKPIGENVRIFCSLNENLEKPEEIIHLNKVNFLYLNENNITLNFEGKNITVKQLESQISFIYSPKQDINIQDNITEYILEFKYLIYDSNPLYLYKHDMKSLRLNSCKRTDDVIRCYVKKDYLLDLLSYSGEIFYLAEKHESEGLIIFKSVLNITLKYKVTQKIMLMDLGMLLTPIVAKNEFVAYEIKGDIGVLTFFTSDYFYIQLENNNITKCIFKKHFNQTNSLLLCNATNDGNYSLGKIKFVYSYKSNIFYDFQLINAKNNEEFFVNNTGTKISSVSPLEIDFRVEKSFIIRYETENPELLNGIKLNINSSEELKCENKKYFKECLVEKSHFTESGYYYTYHTNHFGSKTISYEASPIKVTMPSQNDNKNENKDDEKDYGLIIGVSIAAGIIVIFLIVFLIWHYRRKKNQKDFNVDKETENIELNAPLSSTAKN